MEMVVETRSFRLKDRHEPKLDRLAAKVNYVWNYCNATQKKFFQDHPEKDFLDRFVSFFDFANSVSGSGKLLKAPIQTIIQTCKRYTTSLSNAKNKNGKSMAWLKFRNAKDLRWIPFAAEQIRRLENGKFRFNTGHGLLDFQTMHYENMPEKFTVKDGGSFARDKLGNWYVNLVIEYEPEKHYHQTNRTVGIDPNLDNLAALSNGRKIEDPKFFREAEDEIALIQSRAKKDENGRIESKKTRRKLSKKHRKVARKRKNLHDVESKKITDAFPEIKCGNLSPKWLLQTGFGKSTMDVGLYSFKEKLRYKSIRNGGEFYEVNEAFSTCKCSECGEPTGPKGKENLQIRRWTCSGCGACHDRDVNAAINISRLVPQSPAEGAASRSRTQKTRSGGTDIKADNMSAVRPRAVSG